MKILCLIILCLAKFQYAVLAQENQLIRYIPSVKLGFDNFQTKTKQNDLDYFSSSYNGGYQMSAYFANKLLYKGWFIGIDLGYRFSNQSQNIVFSNTKDLSIDYQVPHKLHSWQFNYMIGREFECSEKILVEVGFGLASNGFFSFESPSRDRSENFESTYIDEDDHWAEEISVEEYNLDIDYNGFSFLSYRFQIGFITPIQTGRISFGITFELNNLNYENFYVISGGNYSAIAWSESKSNSFGVYLKYDFFRK